MLEINRRGFLKTAFVSAVMANQGFSSSPAQDKQIGLSPVKQSSKDTLGTDILVVGAGSSGVPAALAAARNGVNVILLEDDAVPGGAPVDMFVASPCGGPNVGIYKEILDQLQAKHNFSVHPQRRATWFLPSSWARVIAQMLREQPNINIMSNTRVLEVLFGESSQKSIEGVVIQRANNIRQIVKAKVIIDATGAADVADLAGCRSMFGRQARSEFNEPIGPEKPDNKIQECTWMFITHKIRPNAVMDISKTRWIPNESGFGWIKKKDQEEVKKFLKRDAGIYLNWGGHIVCEDTRDPVAIGKAQTEAYKDVIERDAPQLMEFGYGIILAPKLGVRVSRRVVGDYILTVNDLTNPNWPDDVVAVGTYGIDAWGDKTAKPLVIPEKGYGIPYRALLAKEMKNLLVVGKAVSSTHLAQSAVRVQPIVAQMGQSAGTAAALAVKNKTDLRSIEIKKLQQNLKSQGLL